MIIGIGGSSNAGKSHLAQNIVEYFGRDNCIHLCQDNFIKYSGELTKIKGHIDWEMPSSLKIDEYLQAVIEADVKYEIVLAEGLFAFYFNELYTLYIGRIYLELDKETFFSRKREDKRWGIEPTWYIEHIWDSHKNYGKSLLEEPYLSIDAKLENNNILAYNYINGLKKTIPSR